MADMAWVEVDGDAVFLPLIADFTPDSEPVGGYCKGSAPGGVMQCTLEKGHESPWCVAGNVERVVALWRTRK